MAAPIPQKISPVPTSIPMKSGGVGGFLFGNQPATQQFPRFAPEQQAILNQVAPVAWQQILKNQPQFGPLKQQAIEQFQTQTVPTLAERFTAFGGPGTRGSSAFNSAAAGAGAALERQLASDEQLFNMQRQDQLQQLLGLGLTPTFENVYIPGAPGATQRALSNLLGDPQNIKNLLNYASTIGDDQQQNGGWWNKIKSLFGPGVSGAALGAAAGGLPGALAGGVGGLASGFFKPQPQQSPTSQAALRYMGSSPYAPLNTSIANIQNMAQQRGLI